MPTLIPMMTAAGGAAAVRVTSIAPVAVTAKLWLSLPPTVTVPLNVSVVRVVLVVAAVLLLVPLQPATASATSVTPRRTCPTCPARPGLTRRTCPTWPFIELSTSRC